MLADRASSSPRVGARRAALRISPRSAAHDDVVQFKGGVFANAVEVLAHAVQDGTNLVITTGAGDTLTLANVLNANLAADHFAFA